MELQSKENITALLGRNSFFGTPAKKIINRIGYLGGVHELDTLLADRKRRDYMLNFVARPKGLEIVVSLNFKFYRLGILFDEVEFVSIEPQKQIVEQKSKSIVGRALLGGLLFGTVGAIVGGMTGLGTEQIKISEIDNILVIKIARSETYLTFSVLDKHVLEVEEFVKSFFDSKYKLVITDEVYAQYHSSNKEVSVTDELRKLKLLLEDGTLTQEEFEGQKRKLLEG